MTADGQEYDVYLSCPMGAFPDSQKYRDAREVALAISAVLEQDCGLKVFFFGRDFDDREDLDESDLPVAKITHCVQALNKSRYFLLFYPAKMSSSVLVEAGFALSLHKKAVYFVKNREHLPFMLRFSESAFPVKIHQYKTIEGLLRVVKNHGSNLFELSSPRLEGLGLERKAVPAGRSADLHELLKGKLHELRKTVAECCEEIESLEQLLQVDIPSSLNKIRFIAEKVLHTLCVRHAITWGQAEATLERMLGPLISQGVIPKNISVHVRTIQANSSPGSHYQESALSPSHAIIAQQALVEFLEWYSTSPNP